MSRGLWLALALYFAQGLFLAVVLPVWSEQTSAVVSPRFEAIDVERSLAERALVPEPGCGQGLVRSTVRPTAYLCAGRLALPLLGSSYASPVVAWPLAVVWAVGGSFLAVRVAGLAFGALGIVLLFLLVRTLDGDARAVTVALVASVSSPYVALHSLAVYYEVVPTLLVLAALLCWARRPALPPGTALLMGGLLGLAFASNVKAAVVGALALGGLWVSRRALPPARGAALVSLGMVVTAAPFVALVTTDPHAGASQQVLTRLATLLAHLHPWHVLSELGNVVLFASDFAFYIGLAAGRAPAVPWPTVALVGLAFLAAGVHLVRAVRRRPHAVAAAVAAFVVLGYVAFVALVYQQTPAANHGPIVHAFPVLVGYALAMIDRRVATAIALGVLGVTAHVRGEAGWSIPELDPRTLDAVARRLARETGQVVTLAYNHAGVFDALAPLALPTLAAHPLLARCDARDEACLREGLALVACGPGARTIVLPMRAVLVDEAPVALLPRLLQEAAAGCGARLEPDGARPIDVVRVSR